MPSDDHPEFVILNTNDDRSAGWFVCDHCGELTVNVPHDIHLKPGQNFKLGFLGGGDIEELKEIRDQYSRIIRRRQARERREMMPAAYVATAPKMIAG